MEVATGKFPYPKWGSVFEQLYQVIFTVFFFIIITNCSNRLISTINGELPQFVVLSLTFQFDSVENSCVLEV